MYHTSNDFHRLRPAAKGKQAFFKPYLLDMPTCVIFAAFVPFPYASGVWELEDKRRVANVGARGKQVGRRGHSNEGMRATLLIRVYLTAPSLHSCLHHDALCITQHPPCNSFWFVLVWSARKSASGMFYAVLYDLRIRRWFYSKIASFLLFFCDIR